jgi:transmembrane sensor
MKEETRFNKNNDNGRPDEELDKYLSSLSVPAGKDRDAAWKDILLAIDERNKEKSAGNQRLQGYRMIHSKVFIRYAAIAASLLVVALLAVTIARFAGEKTVKAARGEILTISLPDHTEVTLNSESSISYRRMGWKNRRLVSLSGEAYFNVVEGPGFSVVFQSGSVTVVGTSFNLFTRDSDFEVYCRNGSILIESEVAHLSEMLVSGEGLRSETTEEGYRVTRFEMPDEKEIAWIKGEFYYENVPLDNVFSEIERQFNITINAPGVDLSRRYSGIFRRGNLEEALDMVCIPMNLEYSRTGEREITVK